MNESPPHDALPSAAWFHHHAVTDICLRRLHCSPTPSGLFRVCFDRKWRPQGRSHCTVVNQARCIWNFATAYELSGDKAFLDAALAGTQAMRRFYLIPGGIWRRSTTLDGTVIDTTCDNYGQAFAILALATLARVGQREDCWQLACETWDFTQNELLDCYGGSGPSLQSCDPTLRVRSQNPVMHMFEALLALAEAEPGREIHNETEELLRFCLDHLRQRDSGLIPEMYDIHWRPLEDSDGGRIDIGHQFEWAFLLAKAHELGVGNDTLDIGEALLDAALRRGYDYARGGIWDTANTAGLVKIARKGWWQQCEVIRALCRYAGERGRHDLLPLLRQSVAFVRRHFVDAEHGGWFTAPPGLGIPTILDKGDLWKVDYHVVGMACEAARQLPKLNGE